MRTEPAKRNADVPRNADFQPAVSQVSNLLLGAFAFIHFTLAAAEPPNNFFANPSFELGREGWEPSKAGKTECQFVLEENDAVQGRNSAQLKIGSVEDWGVQFGQSFPAGTRGKTYTFAVFARSTGGPVEVGLEIERSARPWDRAAGKKFTLTSGWQELHHSFTVEKDFSEGWFAYLSCRRPNSQIRADLFRLYEGAYVPYEEIAQQEEEAVAVRVFDTGKSSPAPLTGEDMATRAGWAGLSEDDDAHVFKGDAVFMNDRIAMKLRRGAPGAEVYSLGAGGPTLSAVLTPGGGEAASTLSSFAAAEVNPAAALADVVFKAADGKGLALRCELKAGQPFVQTEPRGNVTRLRVEAPCRFAVMPDFFADDIVIDAADLPVAKAELPSDHFLLHLSPGRQAIVMTVATTSEEDIRISLSGEGETRMIGSSELHYGKDGKIWVGIMTDPEIWHQQAIAKEDAGKVMRLDWKTSFPAQWRVDWRREGNLTDSWEMINERPDGRFAKHSLFSGPETIPADRQRWTTVLGTFKYPCWADLGGQAYLQPLEKPALRFRGPAIIYPMNRVPATPLDTFTVLDLVRNTLGVGPCQYILDVEGQQSKYRGRATCSVRDALNPIYAAGQQKQRRAEIEKVLQDLMLFIRHIRGRIEGYVAFGHETLAYLAEQKRGHPELAGRVAELESLASGIDARVAARKTEIKTPEQVAEMIGEFRKNVLDYDGVDALERCQGFTEGWVDIGGNQDELVGECRWAVKMIRQRAGLLMAVDPRMAGIAKEIRERSQVVLRNPAIHEGARH